MTFRKTNVTYIEPAAQWTMVFGIVALCQPWIQWLHAWSVTIMLIGFVTFLVSIHIPPPDPEDEMETGPVSLSGTKSEGGNG